MKNNANAPIYRGSQIIHVQDVPDGAHLEWVDHQPCHGRGCFDCDWFGGWWTLPEPRGSA